MGDDGKCEECAPRTPGGDTERERWSTRSQPRQARLGAAMISALPRASACTSVWLHPRQTMRASRGGQPNHSPSPNPTPTGAQMTRRSTRRRCGSCSWPRRPRGSRRLTASPTSSAAPRPLRGSRGARRCERPVHSRRPSRSWPRCETLCEFRGTVHVFVEKTTRVIAVLEVYTHCAVGMLLLKNDTAHTLSRTELAPPARGRLTRARRNMRSLARSALPVPTPPHDLPPPPRPVAASAASAAPRHRPDRHCLVAAGSASHLPCVARFERRRHSEGRQRRPPLPAAAWCSTQPQDR